MPVEIIVRPTLGSYTARAKGYKATASRSEGARQAAEALVRKLDLGAGQLQEQSSPDLKQGKQLFCFVSTCEMTNKNLLPCPFCGQQDAFVEQLDSDASVVICQGLVGKNLACLARGPVGIQEADIELQPGHDAAVREWNRRAAPTAQGQDKPVAVVKVAFYSEGPKAELVWFSPAEFEPGIENHLYARSQIDEVERLTLQFKEWQASHHANYCKAANERDRLRTLLDEQNALLREIAEDLLLVAASYRQKAQVLLSANADSQNSRAGLLVAEEGSPSV